MNNVIESYLVSLNFQTDEPSFRKLRGILEDTERAVTDHTGGMAKRILETQGAIVGAFTGIAAAVGGVVSKTAMADQQFRLMGLRMMATGTQARELTTISKVLGASLEEIVWDKELSEAAQKLKTSFELLQGLESPDVPKSLKGWRDIFREFNRFEDMDLPALARQFSSDLFKALNPGGNDLDSWLDKKLTYFEQHIPEISEELTRYLVPALKETWVMAQGLGEVLKAGGTAFQSIIGLLSGDESLKGTEFSLEKMATAVEHVAHGFEALLGWITKAELLIAHFADAGALALSGKFKQAADEARAGLKELGTGSGAALGAVFGPGGALIGGALGKVADVARTGALGTEAQQYLTGSTTMQAGAEPKPDEPQYKTGFETLRDWWNPQGLSMPSTPEGQYKTGLQTMRDWWGIHQQSNIYSDLSRAEGMTRGAQAEEFQRKTTIIVKPDEYPPPIATVQPKRGSVDEMMGTIVERALAKGVDPSFALAIAKHESAFNPAAKHLNANGTTDYGLFQLNDLTVKTLGVKDPLDAGQNMDAALGLIGRLTQKYGGDMGKVEAAYAGGEGYVKKHPEFEDWSDEIQKDVRDVLSIQQQIQQQYLKENPTAATTASAGGLQSTQDAQPITPKLDSPDVAPRFRLESWTPPQAREWQPQASMISQPMGVAGGGSTTVQQNVTISIPGIYITQPGANEQQIHRAVSDAIKERLDERVTLDLAQVSPQWN